MEFWEFLATVLGSGALAVFLREAVASYLRVIKGRQEVGNTALQAEIDEQKRQELRTEAYIQQLRKDHEALKAEFNTFKQEAKDKELASNGEKTKVINEKQKLEVKLTKAESRIEQYEEKLRELNVKFKPFNESTKEYPPLKE